VARRDLWDLLFALSGRGITLLVTTHYMDEAERCTDVGYIYLSKLMVSGRPDDLKSLPQVTPPGTRRWEIDVHSPVEQLRRLRELPGVLDATLFGQSIHALVRGGLTEADLSQPLGDGGAVQVRPIEPSLEDVFVTLTRSAEEARAASRPMPAVGPTHAEERCSESRTPGHSGGIPTSSATDVGKTGGLHSNSATKRRRATDGLWAILVKEFFHIRRQPSTLFFMFVIPVLQTLIFGYAINTEIENIPTVIFDQDGRRQALELVEAFENTRVFAVVDWVFDEESFRRALTSGRARVGLKIPPQFSERLIAGQQVQAQVLIDGSDSQVATRAMNTARLLSFNRSLRITRPFGEALPHVPSRDESGRLAIPVEIRPLLLYNPNLESSHFFVPGLVGIILQLVTLFLTAFAIVRERELGTLEQLFVTPVGRAGLLLGKLIPYAAVGFLETLLVLTVMVYVFGVPIHGSILLLLALSALFLVCSLALGLLVSTLARTQLEAMQFAFIIMLPSVLLSGFVFPRSEMPSPIYVITFALPATYFVEILRGVILRSADFRDLVPQAVGLTICSAVILLASLARFRKQLT
jgi:ABC transporter DrrB family efflux protein